MSVKPLKGRRSARLVNLQTEEKKLLLELPLHWVSGSSCSANQITRPSGTCQIPITHHHLSKGLLCLVLLSWKLMKEIKQQIMQLTLSLASYTGKKLWKQNNLVNSSSYKKESKYSWTAPVAFSKVFERYTNSSHNRVSVLLCLTFSAC